MCIRDRVKAAPVESFGSQSMPGTADSGVLDLSLLGLFIQADLVVKTVMMMLLFASIWCWAIIFDKWMMLKSINFKTRNFEKNFWSGQSLENLYEKTKGRETHPTVSYTHLDVYKRQLLCSSCPALTISIFATNR